MKRRAHRFSDLWGVRIARTKPDGAWILARDRKLRLFTLFILYVAQGVPIGLFWFAVPASIAASC